MCQEGTYSLYGDAITIEKFTEKGIALPETPDNVWWYADQRVDMNIEYLEDIPWYASTTAAWVSLVWPNGSWDYKRVYGNSKYQHLGNFNYGATGNYIGFFEWELMAVGGALATYKGQDNPGPFNDQWVDQFWVEQGYKYYDVYY